MECQKAYLFKKSASLPSSASTPSRLAGASRRYLMEMSPTNRPHPFFVSDTYLGDSGHSLRKRIVLSPGSGFTPPVSVFFCRCFALSLDSHHLKGVDRLRYDVIAKGTLHADLLGLLRVTSQHRCCNNAILADTAMSYVSTQQHTWHVPFQCSASRSG
eukprot:1241819-Rhodomonas_salina.1